MSNLSTKQLETAVQTLMSARKILQIDKDQRIFVHRKSIQKLQQDIGAYLERYHTTYPLKAGMPKEELKSKLPRVAAAKIFTMVLNRMLKDGDITQEGETVRLSGHKVALAEDLTGFKNKIVAIYRDSLLQPPYFKEVIKTLNMDAGRAKDVLNLLLNEGTLVKVKEDLYYHIDPLAGLQEKLVDYLIKNDEIETPRFKDMTGASRKYVIPLLEYFDKKNVTIRVGDTRKLRQKN
jgi:selenocysteine-specific elongation factor